MLLPIKQEKKLKKVATSLEEDMDRLVNELTLPLAECKALALSALAKIQYIKLYREEEKAPSFLSNF